MASLHVGDPAPPFTLPDQSGRAHRLPQDARGHWLLLYFYPKDFTPGCTKEACAFRDAWKELQAAGVAVFGVSADTVQSHERFARKYRVPFPLLADTKRSVLRAYGAWGTKKFLGRTFLGIKRISTLIDHGGQIAKRYPAVKPAEHAAEVLADIQRFKTTTT